MKKPASLTLTAVVLLAAALAPPVLAEKPPRVEVDFVLLEPGYRTFLETLTTTTVDAFEAAVSADLAGILADPQRAGFLELTAGTGLADRLIVELGQADSLAPLHAVYFQIRLEGPSVRAGGEPLSVLFRPLVEARKTLGSAESFRVLVGERFKENLVSADLVSQVLSQLVLASGGTVYSPFTGDVAWYWVLPFSFDELPVGPASELVIHPLLVVNGDTDERDQEVQVVGIAGNENLPEPFRGKIRALLLEVEKFRVNLERADEVRGQVIRIKHYEPPEAPVVERASPTGGEE